LVSGSSPLSPTFQPEILLVLDVLNATQRTKQVSGANTVRAPAEQDSILLINPER
jgi:hypothetical protein